MLVSTTLRIILLLYKLTRESMKLQFEFYLLFFTKQLSNPRYISPEKLELFLDFFHQLFQYPTFAVDLYVNYDCDVSSGDILEHLLEMLLKIAFPDQGTINSITLLACDCLALFIRHMASRMQDQVDIPKEAHSLVFIIHFFSVARCSKNGILISWITNC